MIYPADTLFYGGGRCLELFGTLTRRVAPIDRRSEDIVETFARSGTARTVDPTGVLRTAEAGALRVKYVDLDGDDVRETPVVLLEDTTENEALNSEEVGSWGTIETPVVTVDNGLAPDGTTTADEVEDNSGADSEGKLQNITIPDDSTSWTISTHITKTTSGPVCGIVVFFIGGSGGIKTLVFDPITGAINSDAGAGLYGVVEEFPNHWRVWLTMTNDSSGNVTLRPYFYPAARASGNVSAASIDPAQTGSNHSWGWVVENTPFPTSYGAATVGAGLSRAAEQLSFPYYAGPQGATAYMRFIERGTAQVANARLWEIGAAAGTVPRWYVEASGGKYQAVHDPAAASTSQAAAAPSFGDTVEIRVTVASDGAVQIAQSLNDAAEAVATAGDAQAFGAGWSDKLLHVNGLGSGNKGFVEWLDLLFAIGTHSRADCRAATHQ